MILWTLVLKTFTWQYLAAGKKYILATWEKCTGKCTLVVFRKLFFMQRRSLRDFWWSFDTFYAAYAEVSVLRIICESVVVKRFIQNMCYGQPVSVSTTGLRLYCRSWNTTEKSGCSPHIPSPRYCPWVSWWEFSIQGWLRESLTSMPRFYQATIIHYTFSL